MANDSRRAKGKMEEDVNVIYQIKQNQSEECFIELINRHSGIYVDMVHKYISKPIDGIYKEDLLEDKNYFIYDAAINFDEEKNTKFSTYLGNITKWKCLNMYNKSNKFPQQNIEEISHSSAANEDAIESIEKSEELRKINKAIHKSKDPRIKKIFRMRYFNGNKVTPWKKIAKKLDLSIQGCINIHNNYLQEVKKYVQ